MNDNKEVILEKVKLYEHADLYNDMVAEMRKLVATCNGDLENNERKLLSNAYKNVVGKKRSAWRAISLVEQKLEEGDPRKLLAIRYLAKVENELRDECEELLSLLESQLIPNSKAPESRVFFLKMKGDYLRYLAEVSVGEEHDLKAKSKQVYIEAMDISEKELMVAHSYRLGLALNFSVFYYEIENSPQKAYELAKKAFDDAHSELENLKEEELQDSIAIMQLLRDNLTFWSDEN